MTVICMKRDSMAILQFDNVNNIQYNTATGTFTITYNGTTTTLSIANYTIHIMTS